ncbi:MAG: LysM peptidoglycan-binding domain-containing protein [Bdellovibrionales bacterium]|nr:LysM peptidoglycan-binding domain-containing protein [Bdellovibrionales bacterium]
MKKYFLLLLLCLHSSLTLADTTYVVRRGDTVLKIADRQLGDTTGAKDPRRYALARQILAKNPDVKDGNALTIGQTLVIPGMPTKEAAAVTAAPPATVAQAPTTEPAEKAVVAEAAHPVAAASAEAAPPVHQEHSTSVAHGQHPDFWTLQPRVQMVDFHTKDRTTHEKVELHSQLFTGLGLGYGWALGDHSHLLFEVGANYAGVKATSHHDYSIQKKELWLKNFSFGYETRLTHSLHLHVVAQLNDYLILVPTSVASVYAVRSVQMPVAEVALGWSFLHMSSSVLGLGAAAEYVFPGKDAGVKYKTGFEPAATLYWQSENGADQVNYRVDVRYQPTAQKSDFIDQHGTGYGLRLGFVFPL